MSLPKHLPAPLRYWRARVKFLLQPAVWGGVSVLILLVLFSWEFWVNSLAVDDGQSQALQSQVDDFNSQLSDEDSIIGADIDNMASLIVDITRGSNNNPSPGVNLVNPSSQSGPGFFTSILGQQSSNPTPGANPFAQSIPIPGAGPQNAGFSPTTAPTLGTTSFSTLSGPSPGSAFGQSGQPIPGSPFGTSPLTSTPAAVPLVSPLQSAMTQYNQPQTPPSTAQTALPGFGQFSTATPSALPGQGGPGSATSGLPGQSTTPGSSASFIDPTAIDPAAIDPQSLAAPTTPTSSLRSAPSSSSGAGFPASQGTPQSGSGFNSSSGANTPAPQATPSNPPPFSVPNSIGNGEINTFSNP